jgi:hypothetical protein
MKVASGGRERPSSWPLMRPAGVGSEAQGKNKGEMRKKDLLGANTMAPQAWSSDAIKILVRLICRQRKAAVMHGWSCYLSKRHKRGMRPEMRPLVFWPPRRVRRVNVGRCRCIQLLTGLAQAPGARGKLEMVCLLRLGSCEGLKPCSRKYQVRTNPLGKRDLNRLISCRKIWPDEKAV